MNTNVIIILKVLQNKTVSFIIQGNALPTFLLNDSSTIHSQISDYLKNYFNIMSSWLDIRFVNLEVIDKELYIFYSSFVPKEYLNESNITLTNDVSQFDSEIQQSIQQSLRLSPYK